MAKSIVNATVAAPGLSPGTRRMLIHLSTQACNATTDAEYKAHQSLLRNFMSTLPREELKNMVVQHLKGCTTKDCATRRRFGDRVGKRQNQEKQLECAAALLSLGAD